MALMTYIETHGPEDSLCLCFLSECIWCNESEVEELEKNYE